MPSPPPALTPLHRGVPAGSTWLTGCLTGCLSPSPQRAAACGLLHPPHAPRHLLRRLVCGGRGEPAPAPACVLPVHASTHILSLSDDTHTHTAHTTTTTHHTHTTHTRTHTLPRRSPSPSCSPSWTSARRGPPPQTTTLLHSSRCGWGGWGWVVAGCLAGWLTLAGRSLPLQQVAEACGYAPPTVLTSSKSGKGRSELLAHVAQLRELFNKSRHGM